MVSVIQRERYMRCIRPFIGSELIKVLTGFRRSGKSVMLELIRDELRARGIPDTQFITEFRVAAERPILYGTCALCRIVAAHRCRAGKKLSVLGRNSRGNELGKVHQLLPRGF